MPLTLAVCPVHAVERLVRDLGIHEVLAVMPRAECTEDGWGRWPRIDVPRTVVEVSDLGYGGFYTPSMIAEACEDDPGAIPPSASHVEAILSFGRRVLEQAAHADLRVLIHCHGGISLSVAAACLMLALEDGPGRERRTVERLREVCRQGEPSPNCNLIELGDAALHRSGRLAAALFDGSPRSP